MKRFVTLLNAVIISLLGAVSFIYLNVPLPYLLGPIFFCLIAAIVRVPMSGIKPVSDAMRTILGVAIGASITPELFTRLDTMIGSVAFVPLMLIVIGAVGVPYFRFAGFDKPTSFYAAMPGGLQDMLAFGEEAGGDVRALSLIHATRVLVIVAVLPFFLQFFREVDLTVLPGIAADQTSISQMLIMVFCAVFGWWAARKIKLFGASILGPLIVAMILSLSGILTVRPPTEAILLAQFFIGLGIGVKYVGITLKEIRHDITAAIGFCVVLGVISFVFIELVLLLGLGSDIDTLLSFAPGGQAEMAVIAIVAGADVAHVVAHHLVRIVMVIIGAPLFARFTK
ncbi:MAG: AbrB family transcriptional regulator [Lentilitoribacter sp.]